MSDVRRTTPDLTEHGTTRRSFLAGTAAAAASTLVVPAVHAAEDNTIRLALIGSGRRGSGAVANALKAPGGPVKLAVMADLYEDRLEKSHDALAKLFPDQIDVPKDRRFLGFDAYRRAIDALRPGDIAMLTGYAGFRPAQLEYAVEKGVHVFMEKSFAADPPGIERVIRAGRAADKKNVKVAAGLMCRHSRNRQELIRRIQDGQLGEILHSRAYRMHPNGPLGKKPTGQAELEYQIRNFTKFFWVAGGLWSEMNIHQVDELCWLHDALPTTAHGIGGRAVDNDDPSQNLDSYQVEWTFADGSKGYHATRYMRNCHNDFATYVHGTKASAQFSGNIHAGTVIVYKDRRIARDNIAWEAPAEELTPHQQQWNDFLEAVRSDRPFNQAERAARSNLAAVMGRAAVHGGQLVTWDQTAASGFTFHPSIDALTYDGEPPVKADAAGRYPVPVPGSWKEI